MKEFGKNKSSIRIVCASKAPPEWIESCFSWIADSGEIEKISGETNDAFTLESIKNWVGSARFLAVAFSGMEPVAFAVLTSAEADLPPSALELCHLIVHPKARRIYNGSMLVNILLSEAKKQGFSVVFARVVKDNHSALSFFKHLRWDGFVQSENLSSDFKWFQRKVRS